MKTKIFFSITLVLLSLPVIAPAQSTDDTQMLLIHEDIVIPSQYNNYIAASTKLKEALQSNEISGFGFSSFWLYDNSFIHVRPIENFAALDINNWEELQNKMGKEAADDLLANYNGTYHSHRNFIAVYHPSLSYKPEQLQGENTGFREWLYLYYNDGDHDKMMDFLKEWKSLYESKNIDTGYTIYTGGFGHYGPVVVIHTWGLNEADYAEKGEKNRVILEEEATRLWEKTITIVHKQELKRGYFMQSISYMPED